MNVTREIPPTVISLGGQEASELLDWLESVDLTDDIAVSLYEALYAALYPLEVSGD